MGNDSKLDWPIMKIAFRIIMAWLSLALTAIGVGAIEAIASTDRVPPMPGQTWGGLIGLYMIAVAIAAGGLILAVWFLLEKRK